MGNVALLGKHIFTMTISYTWSKNTGSENKLIYNEEKKGIGRSKAGMDS